MSTTRKNAIVTKAVHAKSEEEFVMYTDTTGTKNWAIGDTFFSFGTGANEESQMLFPNAAVAGNGKARLVYPGELVYIVDNNVDDTNDGGVPMIGALTKSNGSDNRQLISFHGYGLDTDYISVRIDFGLHPTSNLPDGENLTNALDNLVPKLDFLLLNGLNHGGTSSNGGAISKAGPTVSSVVASHYPMDQISGETTVTGDPDTKTVAVGNVIKVPLTNTSTSIEVTRTGLYYITLQWNHSSGTAPTAGQVRAYIKRNSDGLKICEAGTTGVTFDSDSGIFGGGTVNLTKGEKMSLVLRLDTGTVDFACQSEMHITFKYIFGQENDPVNNQTVATS